MSRAAWIDRNNSICINTMSSIDMWDIITIQSVPLEFSPHFHDHGTCKTRFWRAHVQKNHISSICADQILNIEQWHWPNYYRASIKFAALEHEGHIVFVPVYSHMFLRKPHLSHHFVHYSHAQWLRPATMASLNTALALHINTQTTTTHRALVHTKQTSTTHPRFCSFCNFSICHQNLKNSRIIGLKHIHSMRIGDCYPMVSKSKESDETATS